MNERPAPVRRETATQVETSGEDNSIALTVVDRILDKGLVVDAWACVPIVGINVVTVDARIYVASWQRYLRYAEAVANTPLAVIPPAVSTEPASLASGTQSGTDEHPVAKNGAL